MARKPKDPREIAARALCDLHGHPPDIKMDGRPMWESYLDEVDAVLTAVGFEAGTVTSVNDNDADRHG
tara:strand:+ start:2789 stop:2992 length:204 start_codon:yes stop_codon:yes gene_type:complete